MGGANILSITPSDVELFLEETKQSLSSIPTPAIVCVGIASGLIIANELSDGAVFEEIADGINFIADKTIEAGKWVGEKIAGLFSKGDKAKPKTKDKTGDENSNQAKDIDLGDVSIWPKPPGDGDFHEGEPSREKPKNRGEKSLYDENGGEWRVHKPDKYHPKMHWDYKPPITYGNPYPSWQDVTIE